MNNNNEMLAVLKRITDLRTELVAGYPFFGRLLLHLTPAIADCKTACTDMEKIIFDPKFTQKLSDEELKFVMLHEVMHCVLKHCIRGQTLNKHLYNIACDIVVNSLVLESMGVKTFSVDGEVPMHLTPDDREGRDFTAEEVYNMLLQKGDGAMLQTNGNSESSAGNGKEPDSENTSILSETAQAVDNHDIWDEISISDSQRLADIWKTRIYATSKKCDSGSEVPQGIKRYLDETKHMPKTNWRQVLADFIKNDKADYTFQRRDTRYSGDIIMPSFEENMYGDAVSELWLCVDTSSSISDEMLGMIYAEILSACAQLDTFSGKMAFFDTSLSDFFPFEGEDDIKKIGPVGGGWTSFHCIFDRLADCDDDKLPVGIVILTDGYASFPNEETARNIPVLWVIVNSNVNPEWGTAVYIKG